MNYKKPLIFITNDDGIDAPGLSHLIEAVKDMGEIVVVAPLHPQSGKSSAITVEGPLRFIQRPEFMGARMMAVNGTPVDCVKLGLAVAVDRKPDILLSGINHGSNSGNSVIYSGTMGAVMEGCMADIPSIGYSLLHHSLNADFSQCGRFIKEITSRVMANGLPKDTCLNVNIPAQCIPKGIKIAEASKGHWTEEFVSYTDPHGRPFYMLTGKFIDNEPDNPATDNYWLDRQYVSVVPVCPDQTHSGAIPEIKILLDNI